MDTTKLFEFEFVDRYNERKKFSNYTNKKNPQKILWVTGKRGIGKTRFVKQMIYKLSDCKIIWIDNSIQNESDNILSQFINELQKINDECFYDFVKDNYRIVLETGKDIIKDLLSDRHLFLTRITEMLFSATSATIEKKSGSKEIYDTFIAYIDKIIKRDSIFIVLDNFSRYEKNHANIFVNLIRKYIDSSNLKFCIITTDEDLQVNDELENKIFMNLPFNNISIEEFPSDIFFGEILRKIFGDDTFNSYDIKYIFDKCEGNPENLIKVIKKSWKRNAINLTDSSAHVKKEILYSILRNETTHFSLKDFSFREQLLLLVIICIGKTINAQFLKLAIDYLSSQIFMFRQFSDELFFETLGKLIDDKILDYGIDDVLLFEHDSTFVDICDILYDLKLKPQICMYLYELILTTNLLSYGYSKDDEEYYKAYYAVEAYIPGWEQINYDYAVSLTRKYLYHDAAVIFDKIPVTYFLEMPKEMFFIACTYYEDGQYLKCNNLLNTLKIDNNCESNFAYEYFFTLGKVENILMDKERAIKHFKKALSIVHKNSPEFVETLNLLHLTYIETENGRNKAKDIFEYVKNNLEDVTPFEWAKTMRGVANFYDGKDALILLNKALNITISENNYIEQAYIENSIGFINLRTGFINEAEKHFSISHKLINEYRKHEISYVLNNRAICHMLNGCYEDALSDLLTALLWNNTPYAYYTINCHLCVCYYFLGQEEEAQRIIKILEEYIFYKKIEDPVVIRKIKMNLGILYNQMGKPLTGNSFFSNINLCDVIGTSSEYRYRMYTNQLDGFISPDENLYYKNTYFEPWILIYGHD